MNLPRRKGQFLYSGPSSQYSHKNLLKIAIMRIFTSTNDPNHIILLLITKILPIPILFYVFSIKTGEVRRWYRAEISHLNRLRCEMPRLVTLMVSVSQFCVRNTCCFMFLALYQTLFGSLSTEQTHYFAIMLYKMPLT